MAEEQVQDVPEKKKDSSYSWSSCHTHTHTTLLLLLGRKVIEGCLYLFFFYWSILYVRTYSSWNMAFSCDDGDGDDDGRGASAKKHEKKRDFFLICASLSHTYMYIPKKKLLHYLFTGNVAVNPKLCSIDVLVSRN